MDIFLLLVHPSEEEGWFMGTLESNNIFGIFPGNYVRFEEDPPGPPIRNIQVNVGSPVVQVFIFHDVFYYLFYISQCSFTSRRKLMLMQLVLQSWARLMH